MGIVGAAPCGRPLLFQPRVGTGAYPYMRGFLQSRISSLVIWRGLAPCGGWVAMSRAAVFTVLMLSCLPACLCGEGEAPRPHAYEFKRVPAPEFPDVEATIAEDTAGRIYFAFPAFAGKDGCLLRWDGEDLDSVVRGEKRLKEIVRGDVGGVATGPGGACYYTLGQDLWMIGWPDADNRMILPAFQGRAGGARRVFVGRLGDIWLEGCPEIQMPDGTMRATPKWPGPPPVPVAADQYGNLWAQGVFGAHPALSSITVLPAGKASAWLGAPPLARLTDGVRAVRCRLLGDDIGFVWAAYSTSVSLQDPRKDEIPGPYPSVGSPAPIQAVGLSPEGKAVAALEDGSLRAMDAVSEGKAVFRAVATDGLPRAAICAIHADSDGGLWVVAGGGIYHAEAAPDAWQRNWKPLARMPWGNHDIFGAVLHGKLYTAAGMASHGFPAEYTHFAELFVYDPRADAWAIAGRMDRPRCYSGVGVLDGKVWVIGGYFGPDKQRVATDEVQVFDPKTGKFSAGPKLDRPRAEPVCDTVGGRFYVIGGADAKEEIKSVVSIGAGEAAWRAEPDAPGPIRQASGCALDGRIYVCAGPQGVLCFHPATGKWQKVEGLAKAPRAALTAAHAGEVWIMGGYDTDEPRGVHVYSPKSGKWRRGPDLPTPLGWGAAVEIGGKPTAAGKLIIAGGAYYSEPHKYYIFTDRTLMLRDR